MALLYFLVREKPSAIHDFLQQSTQRQKASVGLSNVQGEVCYVLEINNSSILYTKFFVCFVTGRNRDELFQKQIYVTSTFLL